MMSRTIWRRLAAVVAMVSLAAVVGLYGQQAQQTQPPKKYEPEYGQAGKDVVWVPTSEILVEKMLDMAKVTAQDFVIDLGSGDGRTVIAAAKRGATAMGIEYNPDMVELSKAKAIEAGVAELVVTFLAILELAKETLIDVTQAEPLAPIYVRLHEEGPALQEPGSEPQEGQLIHE